MIPVLVVKDLRKDIDQQYLKIKRQKKLMSKKKKYLKLKK